MMSEPRTAATDLALGQIARLAKLRRDLDSVIAAKSDGLLRDGYSYSEIAGALGTTRQAARQAHMRRTAPSAAGEAAAS